VFLTFCISFAPFLLQGKSFFAGTAGDNLTLQDALRVGDEAFASGNYRQALDFYRKAVAAEPKNVSAHTKLAMVCLLLHLETEALRAAQSAANMAPDDPASKAVLAKALIRNANYKEGLKSFDSLPPEKREEYGLPQCAGAAKLVVEGEELITNAYQSGQKKDFEAGAAKLEQASRFDPTNLAIKKTLGWLYLEKIHDPPKAYPYLNKVMELQPDDLGVRKLLALACSGTGRFDRALSLFREVLAKDPKDLWMQVNFGDALAFHGKYDQAHAIYEEILRLDPNNLNASLGIARIAAWRAHTKRAVEKYEAILKDNPASPVVHTQLGDLCRWEWQLESARDHYKTALNIQPDYSLAQSGLENIQQMRRLRLNAEDYTFEDRYQFKRSFYGVCIRVPVPHMDGLFVTPRVRRWLFDVPGASDIHRWDDNLDLEYHWGRVFEGHARLFSYNYEGHGAKLGFGLSGRITPTPGVDLYFSYANREPVIDSFMTTTGDYSQDIYSAGADIHIWNRLSAQAGYAFAQYSDHNSRHNATAQLLYKLVKVPDLNVRAQYEIIAFSENRSAYFSPSGYQTYRLSADGSYDIAKWLSVYAVGELPYVKDAGEWGTGFRGGLRLKLFDHIEIHGEYFKYWIPGQVTPWSGDGFQINVSRRF
jgi:tetratricopeptide (TPR) repeat protein